MLTPKTNSQTCWRKAISWWVESSSPFVQHHEFLNVLQPSQSIDNPQTMSTRVIKRRGTCGCELKANEECSVEDCRSVSNPTGFECILRPRTLKAQSPNSDLTRAGRPVAEATKKNPIGAKLSHHNFKKSRNNVDPLQKVYSNVRQKLESSSRRRNAGHRRQRDVLGNIFVSICGSESTSWTRLPR